jgi:hypothetical protein
MANHYHNLNKEKALLWRIVHRDNLPWILSNGVHGRNSTLQDPNYINIGNRELIDRRAHRSVPISPNGTLSDYVPFYFTPFSPMMYNIHTGRGDVPRRSNAEICILVSSLHQVQAMSLPFVFTDRHAYTPLARYFSNTAQLDQVDWQLLQTRNFQRDPNDPVKVERYQAEALIYRHVPVAALIGIVCYTDDLKIQLQKEVAARSLQLNIQAIPGWYF